MHCFLKFPRSRARNSSLSEDTRGQGHWSPFLQGVASISPVPLLSSAAALHNINYPYNNYVISADQRNQHHCPLFAGTSYFLEDRHCTNSYI